MSSVRRRISLTHSLPLALVRFRYDSSYVKRPILSLGTCPTFLSPWFYAARNLSSKKSTFSRDQGNYLHQFHSAKSMSTWKGKISSWAISACFLSVILPWRSKSLSHYAILGLLSVFKFDTYHFKSGFKVVLCVANSCLKSWKWTIEFLEKNCSVRPFSPCQI